MAKPYSFKDFVLVIEHPIAGVFQSNGQLGMSTITFKKTTVRREDDVAADGTVLPSIIAGQGGTVEIEAQQTSIFHQYMLGWANDVDTALDNNDLSNAANGTLIGNAIVEGSLHTAIGLTPQKVPDKPYGAKAQMVTWVLVASEIISE